MNVVVGRPFGGKYMISGDLDTGNRHGRCAEVYMEAGDSEDILQ